MSYAAAVEQRRTRPPIRTIVFFGIVVSEMVLWFTSWTVEFLVLWLVSLGLSAVCAWLVPQPRRWLVGLASLVSFLSVLSFDGRWSLFSWWTLLIEPLLAVALVQIYLMLISRAVPTPDADMLADQQSLPKPSIARRWRWLLTILILLHALGLGQYWAYKDHECAWFDLTHRIRGCALVSTLLDFPANTQKVQLAPAGVLAASAAGERVPLPEEITEESLQTYRQQLRTTANTISLWDLNTGTLLRTLEQPSSVLNITVSPNDQLVATTSFEDQIRVWRISDGSLLHTIPDAKWMAFNADGSLFATAKDDANVRLWSMQDGRLLRTITLAENVGPTDTIVFSPDGSLLVVRDGPDVTLWRVGDGTLQQTLDIDQFPDSNDLSLSFSPDGQTLVTTGREVGTDNHTVRLWRIADGTLLHKLQVNQEPTTERSLIFTGPVAFSPDGTRLVVDILQSPQPSAIMIWRVADGTLLEQIKQPIPTDLIRFSADGTALQLYTASSSSVRIYTQRISETAAQ